MLITVFFWGFKFSSCHRRRLSSGSDTKAGERTTTKQKSSESSGAKSALGWCLAAYGKVGPAGGAGRSGIARYGGAAVLRRRIRTAARAGLRSKDPGSHVPTARPGWWTQYPRTPFFGTGYSGGTEGYLGLWTVGEPALYVWAGASPGAAGESAPHGVSTSRVHVYSPGSYRRGRCVSRAHPTTSVLRSSITKLRY